MAWLEKVLDLGLGGLPMAAKGLCPPHLEKQALERLGDLNPFKRIATNHDLVRATRLAWIEAALEVLDAARKAGRAGHPDAEAIVRFDAALRPELVAARDHALDRRVDVGASPIDRHVEAVIAGVPELVAPGGDAGAGAAVTGGFVAVLTALTGWHAAEIPAIHARLAEDGLASHGGGPQRPFGDLVFAAFAEIIKDPGKYPEAREAFHITRDKVTQDIARAIQDSVQGLDGRLDVVVAEVGALRLLQDGAARHLELLPGIAEDASAARAAAAEARAEAAALKRLLQELLDRFGELERRLAAERGIEEKALRPILLKLGEEGVPFADIPRVLEEKADDLLKLRADLARLRNDRPEFAAIRERALALIDEGDLDAARAALNQGRVAARAAREELSRTEAAFLFDEARIDRLQLNYDAACEKLAEAARLDSGNAAIAIELGALWVTRGSLAKAEAAFRAALEAAVTAGSDEAAAAAGTWLGSVLHSQGNLTAALQNHRNSLAITLRLAAADPENLDLQREISVSHNNIGNVLTEQGNLTRALDSYRASLAIAEHLAKADPGNAGWQRDLSVSHIKIGDVLSAQGNLTGALDSYRADLAIAERLAKADPGNAGWQHDLSVSHNKIGDVLSAQGNLTGALDSYSASLAIRDRLAKADPGNAEWQRDLSVSHIKIGDVLRAQGNLTRALDSYRAGFAIRERLAKADPGNARWQRDLSFSHERIGHVLRAQGDLAAALDRFRTALAIDERLAKGDPGNAGWQRDLAMSYSQIATIQSALGERGAAIEGLSKGRAIVATLIGIAPDLAILRSDLAWFDERIAELGG